MAAKQTKFAQNQGMILVISYLALFITNLVVLFFAHRWFPDHVVLGTVSLTVGWAMILSMSKLALINTFAIPFFNQWELNRGRDLTPMDWMVGYFILNFVGLWLVTRYSHVYGLGVTSWVVVTVIALVMDMLQGVVMMKLEKWRLGE